MIDLESDRAHICTFNREHSLVNKSRNRRKSKVSKTSTHSCLLHPYIQSLLVIVLFNISSVIIK